MSSIQKGLEDWMMEGWMPLMDLLGKVFVEQNGNEKRIWDLDSHGNFSGKSFYRKLMCCGEVSCSSKNLEG